MIYIFVALYAEAKPLIKKLNLNRKNLVKGIQSFCGTYKDLDITLSITGVGMIEASSTCGQILSWAFINDSLSTDNLLINYGSCAYIKNSPLKDSPLYVLNKITNLDNFKSYYPDIFMNGVLENAMETACLCGSQIYSCTYNHKSSLPDTYNVYDYINKNCLEEYLLYDMESAGIYASASKYLSPDKMIFLKFASDVGDLKEISPESIFRESEKHYDAFLKILDSVNFKTKNTSINVDTAYIQKLSEFLDCSATMEEQLKQYLHYADIMDIDYRKFFKGVVKNDMKSSLNRRNGKALLDDFRRYLERLGEGHE